MRFLALLVLVPAFVFGQTTSIPVSLESANVNSRYTIETIDLDTRIDKRISRSLREEIGLLTGDRFDASKVSDLALRIGKEIRQKVTSSIEKGQKPEQVRVVLRSSERTRFVADASLEKFRYNSQLGSTVHLKTDMEVLGNRLAVGFLSDAEDQLERNIGWSLDVSRPLSERIRVHLAFQALHQKWNGSTIVALASRPDIPGIYRERYSVEPTIQFALLDGVTLSTGVSLQYFETQFPAARFETSSAWINTLRFHKNWESDDSSTRQGMDAGYSLRAATKSLNGDFAYTRQLAYVTYSYRFGTEEITTRAMVGRLSGTAPLFERFVLGDSQTLRGWNRFDLDPLGGDRVVHGSIQYRYKHVGVFYDTGIIWDHAESKQARHAAGVLAVLTSKADAPYISLAFPLHAGSIVPMLMLGMNF